MRSFDHYKAGFETLPEALQKQLERMTTDGPGVFACACAFWHSGELGFMARTNEEIKGIITGLYGPEEAGPFLGPLEMLIGTFADWETVLFWEFFRVYLDYFQEWELASLELCCDARVEEQRTFYNRLD